MTRVAVAVQPRAYDVVIESGILSQAGARLRELFPQRKHCFIVTVAIVRRHWGRDLRASLSANGWTAKFVLMPDGERYKTLATVEKLAEKLVKAGADRGALVVAFGGGVVGDVTGLLASIYMRGVDFVQIPTTLLAQVDASVGGKTGVNLKAGKNLVGTFYQPRVVLIDPTMLSTLPAREFQSGLYEALKCGVIGNPELFSRLETGRDKLFKRDPAMLEYIIAESVRLKAAVVAADERDVGLRRVLNFGHTIGHALESQTAYRHFLHGEAVAWGMVAASIIAAALKKTDRQTAQRISRATVNLGPLPKVDVNPRGLLRAMQSDKKTKNGAVHFVLPREIGKVEVVNDVPEAVVLEAIKQLRVLSR
ncbi:MAG TPA: 3-dehydroquinate synthase [Terriglobales bacterium]|nr:3-dehydroquinate synthase [Terriglobales bacterium]